MRIAIAALGLALLLAANAGAADVHPNVGGEHESHIYTSNESSDYFIWVTAIGYTDLGIGHIAKNLGAWCVAPKAFDTHGLRADVTDVRLEVSHTRCQGNILMHKVFPFNQARSTEQFVLKKYLHPAGGFTYQLEHVW